jgi:hypothetical protein
MNAAIDQEIDLSIFGSFDEDFFELCRDVDLCRKLQDGGAPTNPDDLEFWEYHVSICAANQLTRVAALQPCRTSNANRKDVKSTTIFSAI